MRFTVALTVCTLAAHASAQTHPGLRGRLGGERTDERSRFARLLDTRPASTSGNAAAQRKARQEHLRKKRLQIEAFAREAPSLSLAEKADLLDALQRHGSGRARDEAIAATLLSTHGADLTALKDLIDRGGDRYDLEQLVFHDLGDEDLREQVLAHIANEARSTGIRKLRVVSDIDDTLYANYKDERYPKGTLYPGVLALHRELGGADNHAAFITARPGDCNGWIEGRTHRSLRERGVEAAVLTGSFGSVVTPARMANMKLENFDRYRQLFPEYDAVWLGDSGQADAAFGAAARERHGNALRAALIHDVVGRDADTKQGFRDQGVEFFDTYVGAAIHAHRQGLIDGPALARVAAAAQRDQEAIAFDDPEQESAAAALLARDLEAARAITG